MKLFKIIIASGFIVILLFFSYTWIYSALTHNAFREKVEISEKEKDFIKKIQNECNCELRYEYKKESELDQNFNRDKNLVLELRSYNEYNNWCKQDSTFVKEKAFMMIKDFIYVSDHSHLYENILLLFTVYKDIGTEEELIQNICEKRIEYNIQKEEMKYTE